MRGAKRRRRAVHGRLPSAWAGDGSVRRRRSWRAWGRRRHAGSGGRLSRLPLEAATRANLPAGRRQCLLGRHDAKGARSDSCNGRGGLRPSKARDRRARLRSLCTLVEHPFAGEVGRFPGFRRLQALAAKVSMRELSVASLRMAEGSSCAGGTSVGCCDRGGRGIVSDRRRRSRPWCRRRHSCVAQPTTTRSVSRRMSGGEYVRKRLFTV